MDSILKSVEDFAAEAHRGQMRKFTPDPYIIHPIKVMELCRKHTSSVPVLASALLHDVLEDTAVTEDQLKEFLLGIMTEKDATNTLRLVVEMTDVYVKKNYPHWNRRKRKAAESKRMEATSSEAQTVKYADIIDNCNDLGDDKDFAKLFLHECRALLRSMSKGNPRLYEAAVEKVNKSFEQIEAK